MLLPMGHLWSAEHGGYGLFTRLWRLYQPLDFLLFLIYCLCHCDFVDATFSTIVFSMNLRSSSFQFGLLDQLLIDLVLLDFSQDLLLQRCQVLFLCWVLLSSSRLGFSLLFLCIVISLTWILIRPRLEDSLKVHQLPLEAEVGEHDGPPLPHERHRFEEGHAWLLHQISNDNRSRSGDASETMYEHCTTTGDSFLNELNGWREMLDDVYIRHVQYAYHFVPEIL